MENSKYCICVGPCAQQELSSGKKISVINGKQKIGTVCQVTKQTIEIVKDK